MAIAVLLRTPGGHLDTAPELSLRSVSCLSHPARPAGGADPGPGAGGGAAPGARGGRLGGAAAAAGGGGRRGHGGRCHLRAAPVRQRRSAACQSPNARSSAATSIRTDRGSTLLRRTSWLTNSTDTPTERARGSRCASPRGTAKGRSSPMRRLSKRQRKFGIPLQIFSAFEFAPHTRRGRDSH